MVTLNSVKMFHRPTRVYPGHYLYVKCICSHERCFLHSSQKTT